jgi:tol-pal system protein YbgF
MPGVRPAALVMTAMLALLAAACASTPEDDPVQQKLNDLDARETRVERESAGMVEMSQRVAELQSEVRQLRGRIDEVEHENAQLRQEQHDLYNDLSKRIGGGQAGSPGPGEAGSAGNSGGTAGTAETGGAAGGGSASEGPEGAAGGAAGSSQPSTVEQAVYNQSFDALRAGSYSVAITSFKNFLSTYPQSPLAPNAQYWLGEAYYVSRDYDSASGAFRAVLKKWPDSAKAPSALLKLGFAQFDQKQYAAARATLAQVTQKYPGSDSAKQAADRLRRIPAQ